MGGKTVTNLSFDIDDVKIKKQEFNFSKGVEYKTIQLCSTLRQNRILMAEIDQLEQELKSLQKERLKSFAKLIPVPLPRGKNTYKRSFNRKPAELDDEFSFTKSLLGIPNFVYGIVHECSDWLVVNLDVTKLCIKFHKHSTDCTQCHRLKSIRRKTKIAIIRKFVECGNGLRTLIFRKPSGPSSKVYAESSLTEYKGYNAYQTYVTIESRQFGTKKFAVNGFPYYETALYLPKGAWLDLF